MAAEEKARWIVDNTRYDPTVGSKGSRVDYFFEYLLEEITKAIKDTEAQGREEGVALGKDLGLMAAADKAYEKGFVEGLKQAAEIADKATIWDAGVVRQQILALLPEEGK